MADEEHPIVLSATTLMGNDVKNAEGETLGSIEEFMVDIDYGVIAYAVLSFGGIMGMGDKLFAIPWEAMVLDTQEKCFILDVDKEVLENAEGFDKNDWPDFADYEWGMKTYQYYGYTPYWEAIEE